MTTTVQTSCSSVSHTTKEGPRLRGLQTMPWGDKPIPCNAVSHMEAKRYNGILSPVTNYNMKSLLLTTVMFLDKFQCMHWVNAHVNSLYQ